MNSDKQNDKVSAIIASTRADKFITNRPINVEPVSSDKRGFSRFDRISVEQMLEIGNKILEEKKCQLTESKNT